MEFWQAAVVLTAYIIGFAVIVAPDVSGQVSERFKAIGVVLWTVVCIATVFAFVYINS